MIQRVLYVTMLFFLLGFGTTVAASSFYNVGKNLSTRLAQSVWDDLKHDCHKVDTFLKLVGNSVDRTKKTLRLYAQQGHNVEDFGTGYIYGLLKIFKVVTVHCQRECSKVGRTAGRLTSEVFCEISQAIGRTATFRWLEDIPNIICGESYRTSCESIFYSNATSECPYYSKGYAFDKYYSASSNGCCAYNPN